MILRRRCIRWWISQLSVAWTTSVRVSSIRAVIPRTTSRCSAGPDSPPGSGLSSSGSSIGGWSSTRAVDPKRFFRS